MEKEGRILGGFGKKSTAKRNRTSRKSLPVLPENSSISIGDEFMHDSIKVAQDVQPDQATVNNGTVSNEIRVNEDDEVLWIDRDPKRQRLEEETTHDRRDDELRIVIDREVAEILEEE